MATQAATGLPQSIEETMALLEAHDYLAGTALATVLFLALRMKRPLFLEGEAGVGKTEIAKVLAKALDRPLIRLQCYEGLDLSSAVYEWNYPAQMLEIRLSEASGKVDRKAATLLAQQRTAAGMAWLATSNENDSAPADTR